MSTFTVISDTFSGFPHDILSITGDELKSEGKFDMQPGNKLHGYKSFNSKIVILHVGTSKKSDLFFFDIKEEKVITSFNDVEYFTFHFPYLCTLSDKKDYINTQKIWNVKDVMHPIKLMEFPSVASQDFDFTFFNSITGKEENPDRIITYHSREPHLMNPNTGEMKKICDINRQDIKRIVIWNDKIVIVHRNDHINFRQISFYPLNLTYWKEELKTITTEKNIHTIYPCPNGDVVIICCDYQIDKEKPAGYVDIVTPDFKLSRLSDEGSFNTDICGNLLAIQFECGRHYLIKIYDIEKKKSSKAIFSEYNCFRLKLIGDEILLQNTNGIHVVSLKENSAKIFPVKGYGYYDFLSYTKA
jgi:hypothetical protein